MGIGSYAGGLSRGIQNGVNISLALRADKRAEENRKLGIQRQEKLDSRADTLFSQSQEDRARKAKVDELNSRMNSYALKLASLGDINNIDSQTLTDIYKQEGMFADLAKPNQMNFHIADYNDGKTKGKIIQFNQQDDKGNLILNQDGTPKWFSVTKTRGTMDEGVVMPASYMVSNAFAKMVEQGADGKAALSLYDKKLTEREKLALQHKYKLDEQNNASSNKAKEKRLGIGGDLPSDAKMVNFLVSNGIASDKKDAFSMVRTSKSNPIDLAVKLAKQSMDAQEATMIQPGDEGYKTAQQHMEEAMKFISNIQGNKKQTKQETKMSPQTSQPKTTQAFGITQPQMATDTPSIPVLTTASNARTTEDIQLEMKDIEESQNPRSPLDVRLSEKYRELRKELEAAVLADNNRARELQAFEISSNHPAAGIGNRSIVEAFMRKPQETQSAQKDFSALWGGQ